MWFVLFLCNFVVVERSFACSFFFFNFFSVFFFHFSFYIFFTYTHTGRFLCGILCNIRICLYVFLSKTHTLGNIKACSSHSTTLMRFAENFFQCVCTFYWVFESFFLSVFRPCSLCVISRPYDNSDRVYVCVGFYCFHRINLLFSLWYVPYMHDRVSL